MRLKSEFKVKDLYMIDPRRIEVVPGLNKRHDTPDYMEYRQGIKEMIRANGITEPLTIRVDGERILLSHGHTRLWSVMSLIGEGEEWAAIPCRPEEKGVSEADRFASQVIQNTGREFTPPEKADVVKELQSRGWDEDKIAIKLGLSKTRINDLLKLLECAPEVMAKVESGEISSSTAIKVQKESPAEAPAILQEAGEIAKAAGAPRTTPKHVKQAQEARAEAKANPEQETPAKKVRIDWLGTGPKMLKHLDAICNATDPKKAIEKAYLFRVATFGEI